MADKGNFPDSHDYKDSPNPKKWRVSLKLDKQQPRFTYYSSGEISKLSKGFVPPNNCKEHSLGQKVLYGLDFGHKYSAQCPWHHATGAHIKAQT